MATITFIDYSPLKHIVVQNGGVEEEEHPRESPVPGPDTVSFVHIFTQLSYFGPLKSCSALQHLNLSHNSLSSHWAAPGCLGDLPCLKTVNLSFNPDLSSLSPLNGCQSLQSLSCLYTNVENPREIEYCFSSSRLQTLLLAGNPLLLVVDLSNYR